MENPQTPENVVPQKDYGQIITPDPIIEEPKSKFRHLPLIIVGIVLVLLLIVLTGVYVVYGQGKTKWGQDFQNKVWSGIIDGYGKLQSADTTSTVTYQDTGTFNFVPSVITKQLGLPTPAAELKSYDDMYGFTLSNMEISNKTSLYMNLSDSKNPKIDAAMQSTFNNNGQSYAGNIGLKLQTPNAFLLYDYNQALQNSKLGKMLLASGQYNQFKNTWLKLTNQFNPDTYAKQLTDTSTTNQKFFDTLKNNRLFDIKSFKGVSLVNGYWSWHYQFSLNKVNLKNLYVSELNPIISSMSDTDKQYYMQFVDILISKYDLQNMDVWIGISDHKIYKVDYKSNALSITQTLNQIDKSLTTPGGIAQLLGNFGSPISNSGDTKRISDVREMATALEIYYNDNQGYPTGSNGVAFGLVPEYLSVYPSAPTPAGGKCSDYYNSYWYAPEGSATTVVNSQGNTVTVYPSYKITFCLGGDASGIKTGVNFMTPTGVQPDSADTAKLNKSIPSQNKVSVDPEQQIKDFILTFVKNLPCSATITVEENINSYNSNKNVQMPTDYKDISVIMPQVSPSQPDLSIDHAVSK